MLPASLDPAQLAGWLAAVADGDRAAFEPLFAALWPIVSRYCRRMLGDDALGDDAAQEAMLRVLTRAGEHDRARPVLPWVLGVATWQCRTARRQRQRRGETALPTHPAALGVVDGAALVAQRALVRDAVAAALALPAGDVDTLAAAIHDDPALRGDVAPATFRKRLERTLGRLRLSWRSRYGES